MNMFEAVHGEMITMVNFMLCIFYRKFKKINKKITASLLKVGTLAGVLEGMLFTMSPPRLNCLTMDP